MQSRLKLRRLARRVSWAIERQLGPGSTVAPYEFRRQIALEAFHIDVVLDVGANAGQYGSELRANGYGGRIVSFEPVSAPFVRLSACAAEDRHWDVVQTAIADVEADAKINVSANAAKSSSFLPQSDLEIGTTSTARYTHTELVTQRRLDHIAPAMLQPRDRVALKLDVQGYELRCLQGAEGLMQQVHLVEAELSLYPLYEDQKTYLEMITYLSALGFKLWSIEPLYMEYDRGRLIEMDALFARPAASSDTQAD